MRYYHKHMYIFLHQKTSKTNNCNIMRMCTRRALKVSDVKHKWQIDSTVSNTAMIKPFNYNETSSSFQNLENDKYFRMHISNSYVKSAGLNLRMKPK